MNWPERYIGVAFVARGRDHTGLDCYGLARLVYAEERGIDLPSHDTVDPADLRAAASMIAFCRVLDPVWMPAPQPAEFDLVLLTGLVGDGCNKRRVPVHVGVVAPGNHILHIERGTDAVCVPLDHWSVRERIVGYYKYRGA